ncbi:MAG TPA: SRPBCC family protein [Tepidiformaceae bacterium]|nr:SRPBCC family protein [Tepidiformaceae bacterium]
MRTEVEFEVEASPEDVWAVMKDVERWPEWSESITSAALENARVLGAGVSARIKQPRVPAMTWQVTDYVEGERFTWEATTTGSKSVAWHSVSEIAPGRTKVVLGVEQTGVLVPILKPLLGRMTKRFVAMEAEGLKRRAELRAAA